MKTPAGLTVRAAAAIAVVLLVATFVLYVSYLRHKGEKFDNVVAKLETTEDSAAISRKAGEAAGSVVQENQYELSKDIAAVEAARRPDATDADFERLRQRIAKAYLEGLCAERRLQRKDCGAELPASPDD